MKKSYTIAGIGVCLGKKPGLEAFAEATIIGSAIAAGFLLSVFAKYVNI